MAFEILILTKNWLLNTADENSRSNIAKLINKAYSRVHFKYKYICSPRISSSDMLNHDLDVDTYSEFCFYVLLGPARKFETWKSQGLEREFSPTTSMDDAYDSNLSHHHIEELKFEVNDVYPVVVANEQFQFDENVLHRSIATCGFKANRATDPVKQVYLTTFTSFMRGSAPKFLEIVINQCLLKATNFSYFSNDNLLDLTKFIIHADVIKEHELVDYYTTKCKFETEDKEEIYVAKDDSSPFKDEITIVKPFTISFICREVLVK